MQQREDEAKSQYCRANNTQRSWEIRESSSLWTSHWDSLTKLQGKIDAADNTEKTEIIKHCENIVLPRTIRFSHHTNIEGNVKIVAEYKWGVHDLIACTRRAWFVVGGLAVLAMLEAW